MQQKVTNKSMRVTMAFTNEEWGILHLVKSLYSIFDPAVSTTPGPSEIVRGILPFTAYSIADNVGNKSDFIDDMTINRATSGFNSLPKGNIDELRVIMKNTLTSYIKASSLWTEKLGFRTTKWVNSSVFPSGNFIINLTDEDQKIIDYLSKIMMDEEIPESKRTASQIIRKCLRFLLNDPFTTLDFVAKTALPNLYGLPLWFPYRDYLFVRTGESNGADGIAGHISQLSKSFKNLYSKPLECIKKDERVYMDFLKELLEKTLPLSPEDVRSMASKYWSYKGFSFMSVFVNFGVAIGIALSPDLWIDAFVMDKNLANSVFTAVPVFHQAYLMLMSMSHGPEELTKEDIANQSLPFYEACKIDTKPFMQKYFKTYMKEVATSNEEDTTSIGTKTKRR